MLAQTTTSPWWGVPLIAGTFTVIGVLLAQLSAFLNEKRKADREDKRRWDPELRQLCAKLSVINYRMKEHLWEVYQEPNTPVPKEDIDAINLILSELELIAPSEIHKAADKVRGAIVAALLHRKRTQMDSYLREYEKATIDYVNVARSHFGVKPFEGRRGLLHTG